MDAYKEGEKKEISNALDTLCKATDAYGWASAGIYSYWNYETRKVLYVGLAVDLNERFKQHNGFYPGIDPNSCKKDFIDAYFKENEKLGITIVVQSTLSQPSIRKVREQFESLFEGKSSAQEIGNDGVNEIQRLEGILIEAYRQSNGIFPAWNKMSGSINGQQAVRLANYDALRVIANHETHYLTARSTLREIAANPTLERYENFLHAVRIMVPVMGAEKAFQMLNEQDPIGTFGHIQRDKYLEKKIVL